jgi:hypothetical protein
MHGMGLYKGACEEGRCRTCAIALNRPRKSGRSGATLFPSHIHIESIYRYVRVSLFLYLCVYLCVCLCVSVSLFV